MALPATDNFSGTNDQPITTSGNWGAGPTDSGCTYYTNWAYGGSHPGVNYWTADAFSNDQYSKIKLVAATIPAYSGVTVRHSNSVRTHYLFYTVSGTTFQLYKRINGSYTQIGSDYSINYVQNAYIELSISGTTLTPSYNGVAQSTQTDSAIDAGAAGIFISGTLADDWEGGDVAAGGNTYTASGALTASGAVSRGHCEFNRTQSGAL